MAIIVREVFVGILTWMSAVTVIEGQSCSTITCEQITISNCQGLSYTTTGFPNFFSQTSQAETIAFDSFIPSLVGLNCSAQTKEFVCGALVPECVENSGLIYPTKSMCGDFFSGCAAQLMESGIPLDIDCNTLPESSSPVCYAGPAIIPTQNAPGDTSGITDNSGTTMKPVSSNTTEELVNTTTPCSIPCEEITISQCESLPYTLTGFPNFFGHPSITIVDEYAFYIDIVVAINCYADSRKLLCGSLLPECRENEGLILPSKKECEDFFEGCGTVYEQQGGGALEIDCNDFPVIPEPVCYAQPTMPSTTRLVTEEPTNTPKPVAATLGSSGIFNLYSISLLVLSCVILQQLAR